MKFTLPEGAFPAVALSKSRQDELVSEAMSVVSETVAANEAFLADGAKLRSPRWRLVRAKEGLQVYRQRSASFGSFNALSSAGLSEEPLSPELQSASWTSGHSFKRNKGRAGSKKALAEATAALSPSSVATEGGLVDAMRRPGVPLMALHGTVDGSLDDSMFGAFAASDQAWKWRSSHINDRFDDARLLASITRPSRRDPFRFLGVKWFAKEHPAVLSGLVQRRDFLILEATGLTRDSQGEKVGYFLMHSVALPDVVPELSEMGIIRGSLSFCFLLRQNGPGRIELYCRGFTDPRGEMMERVSVAIAAESLICVAGVVDYAYIKKLTWFMQHREHESLVSQRESHRQHRVARAGESRCEACGKNFTRFGLLAVATGTATAGTGAACQICRRVVCAKCSVLKKMTVDVSDAGAVTQRALRFCLGCLLEAKEFSAWDMAISSLPTSPVSPSSSSSASASGSIPSTPPPPPVSSVSRKLIHTRGPRSYSEYQRTSTRVPRRGEMVADFTRTEDPPASAIIQQSKSRSNRQQAAPGTHSTSRPVKSHRNRIPQPPPLNGDGGVSMRHSERPKSSRRMADKTTTY